MDAVRAARRDVERWFVSRGVPQLITGYGDEQRLDARATPLIIGWLVLGTVLWWATRREWTPAWNALMVALALAFMAIVYAGITRLRGRRILERPRTWDLADIATFGVLPAIPAGVVHGPFAGLLALGNALLGVAAIYVVIGFGIPEIAWWAIRRIGNQLEHIVWLISRTLPLLLILVIFLLFAAEIWEAARSLEGIEVLFIIALLALVAVLLIVTTLKSELERIEARSDWAELTQAAMATPAAALVDLVPPTAPPPPRFRGLEHANLTTLVLVSQLVQSVFVALVVAGFLVLFGLIALPESVQESWAGEAVRALLRFEFMGDGRMLSAELLFVGILLGGIIGLYFTGLALTDASYRSQHFALVVEELEQIAAVRAVYLAAGREAPGRKVSPRRRGCRG